MSEYKILETILKIEAVWRIESKKMFKPPYFMVFPVIITEIEGRWIAYDVASKKYFISKTEKELKEILTRTYYDNAENFYTKDVIWILDFIDDPKYIKYRITKMWFEDYVKR